MGVQFLLENDIRRKHCEMNHLDLGKVKEVFKLFTDKDCFQSFPFHCSYLGRSHPSNVQWAQYTLLFQK